jgi:hypothetical protein
VVDGIAVAQALGRSRQVGFGQFSSRLHGFARPFTAPKSFSLNDSKYCHPGALPCVQ